MRAIYIIRKRNTSGNSFMSIKSSNKNLSLENPLLLKNLSNNHHKLDCI